MTRFGNSVPVELSRRMRVFVESRTRQGWARVRSATLPVLVASAGAAAAYALAGLVPGHTAPFFAGIAAWICLGFSTERQLRKVIELALGVTLGIALGDLFINVVGTGAWQIAVALLVSALVARFLDAGAIVTVQAGVQAVVVVGLPAFASAGPFSRVIDAAIGSAVALLITIVFPGDVRRWIRAQAKAGFGELAVVLDSLADAVRLGEREKVEDALERARQTQPVIDAWESTLQAARQLARVSPPARRHNVEIAQSAHACQHVDWAIRTARVIARRAILLTEHGLAQPELGQEFTALAKAVRRLGDEFGAGRDGVRVRDDVMAVAGQLSTDTLNAMDPTKLTLVHLTRSMVVDILCTTGMEPATARTLLPPLEKK